jgi:hypothetical protein
MELSWSLEEREDEGFFKIYLLYSTVFGQKFDDPPRPQVV